MRRKQLEAEPEIEVSERDFVMARVAAARTFLRMTEDALDAFITHCVDPDDDPKGKERKDLLEEALNQIGSATRCLESAEEALPAVDFEEIEPWEEED